MSMKEVTLFVRKVKPNTAIQLAHVNALQHGTAKYPLRRVEVKSFTVPTGNQSITKERTKNIFKKVCALDQLEKPTFLSAYVINSDLSSEPGEHWIAVYFDKRG